MADATAQVKAIETRWNGYRFRSRTEARWAVLLNRLGIQFEYELEGYSLPSGVAYLPDFYLPKLNCILEVKPDLESDLSKPAELAASIAIPVYVACGSPKMPGNTPIVRIVEGCAVPSGLVECPICGIVSFACKGDDIHDWLVCRCLSDGIEAAILRLPPFLRSRGTTPKTYALLWNALAYPGATEKISAAFDAAMSARFEHGESPEVGRP